VAAGRLLDQPDGRRDPIGEVVAGFGERGVWEAAAEVGEEGRRVVAEGDGTHPGVGRGDQHGPERTIGDGRSGRACGRPPG
jgi:hypothetical protein